MKTQRIISLFRIATLFILIGLYACKPEIDIIVTPVEASFSVNPDASGLTTTNFTFDARQSLTEANAKNPVFIRWDWESDGEWDNSFSTKSIHNHRYFTPGDYTVTMEVSNINGDRDISSILLHIEQGYSPPRADFVALPDSANILHTFIFNAISSKDDEDSLSSLMFRWDFQGDLHWDTPFESSYISEFKYSTPSNYLVRLEVLDPSGLKNLVEKEIVVNLYNDSIHPSYSFDCKHCTIEDTIDFDASDSYHDNPMRSLYYSWDFGDDGIWEFENLDNPLISGQIEREGANPVRLRIADDQGLIMDLVDTVKLFGMNSEPIANLALSSHVGNPSSEFYLHAKGSSDRDESMLDLSYRWDIDGDGSWDSQFDDQIEINTKFSQVGKYGITLGVKDSGDKWGYAVDTIEIFEGTHETSYIIDKRGSFGGDLYGTVKIGSQWWMQENLRYANPYLTPPVISNYYKNNLTFFYEFGGLYFPRDLYHDRGLCPRGWKVPSLDDFQVLFDYLEEDITSQLIYGGESEFHVKLGGWIESDIISTGYPHMTHLWTADRNIQGQLPIGIFINTKPSDTRVVYVNDHSAYYVRCIKE